VHPAITFASLSHTQDHACGVDLVGKAYCWGSFSSGELGDGTTDPRIGAVAVLSPE
jgi:alpha-tubulin suppressor-like RCC1 family protein